MNLDYNNKDKLQRLFDEVYNRPANTWMEIQAQTQCLCNLAQTINSLKDEHRSRPEGTKPLRPMQQFNRDFWSGFEEYISKLRILWPYRPIKDKTYQRVSFFFNEMRGYAMVKVINDEHEIRIEITFKPTMRELDFIRKNPFILENTDYQMTEENSLTLFSAVSKNDREQDYSILYQDISHDLLELARLVKGIEDK